MPFSNTGSHTQTSSTLLPNNTSLSIPQSALSPPSSMEMATLTAYEVVQIVAANTVSLQSLDCVLQCLSIVKHVVKELPIPCHFPSSWIYS